ncbi:MAG TPA: P-loop NTPase fold protein [Methanosarcina sp.]|jgi:predicted KAP-like P-loop ATPase
MYAPDKAIESCREDFLHRTDFSQKLAQSIISWNEKESLVLSICGEWGYGKSSVINLMKEWFEIENKEITIFEFNPWIFSGEGDLSKYFFEELAKELSNSKTEKDEEIAKKLRLYSKLLDLIPEKSGYSFIKDSFTILSLVGIGASILIETFHFQTVTVSYIKNIFLIVSFICIAITFSKDFLNKLADYFDSSEKLDNTSVLSLKKDLQNTLKERDKKLLVIIDDIDRLSQSEMRQIFKLVKINTDFPNTIYVLSFDEKVVTCNLSEQIGVSGRDYLNKIVQIIFNVPHVKQHKINEFLLKEIDRILSTLPPSKKHYYNEMYYANIYNSGFKNFFRTIRDVKRFSNSLEFNISLMHKEYSMEVNPIDFIAIESIRVFCPDFYYTMKSRKTLFTKVKIDRDDGRKEEIEAILKEVDEKYRNDLNSLLFALFPQMSTIFGNTEYGYEVQSIWNKQLRVCSTNYFDAYFTLIPGGDEEELSQYELDSILKKIRNMEQFENLLIQYIDNKKINKVLWRLQDYTNDENHMSIEYAENVVQVIFDISDSLPNKKEKGQFETILDAERIILQILKRQKDVIKNYEIFKNTIPLSKGLAGPVEIISFESEATEENRLVPVEKLNELQLLCVSKIKEFSDNGKLIDNDDFVSILYRWKEWDDSKGWKTYIKKLISTDDGLITFVEKFIYENSRQTVFSYDDLNQFAEPQIVKYRLQKMKQTNNIQYENKKDIIDIFLKDFKENV